MWLLALQTTAAVMGLEILRRRVWCAGGAADRDEFIVIGSTPLAVVLPLVLHTARVEHTIQGLGSFTMSVPVICAFVAISASLLVDGRSARASASPSPWEFVGWFGSGLALVLLTAAHELTGLVGQFSFALGAVLLWMAAPLYHKDRSTDRPINPAMSFVMLLAVGQGILGGFVLPADWVGASAMIAGVYAIMAIAIVGRHGGLTVIRVGVWASTYGILFGLGVLALVRVLPATMQVVSDRAAIAPGQLTRIAFGFGTLAPEGLALIAVAALGVGMLVGAVKLPRIVGYIGVVLAVAWFGWRLVGLLAVW